jgi:hypothetical protein
MTDLVLEHLRRIQSRLDGIEKEITGLKAVISSHEVMASLLKNDVRRESDILSLEQRIARVERRVRRAKVTYSYPSHSPPGDGTLRLDPLPAR